MYKCTEQYTDTVRFTEHTVSSSAAPLWVLNRISRPLSQFLNNDFKTVQLQNKFNSHY